MNMIESFDKAWRPGATLELAACVQRFAYSVESTACEDVYSFPRHALYGSASHVIVPHQTAHSQNSAMLGAETGKLRV